MAVHDVEELNVYFSATGAAGTFTAVPEATGLAFTSDAENNATVRVFGGVKHVRTGDDADTYEISGLFDAVGQKAIRDAKRAGSLVHLILVWDDEGYNTPANATPVGQRQSVRIDSYNWEGDADGDFARMSFTATGEGALTEINVEP